MTTASVEEALRFSCGGESLLGVLSLPPPAPVEGEQADISGTALLIIVGGPQYRAGSHRQFVLLARALARHGHAVLRFDPRGSGDSSGAPRSFEHISDDIGAALDALQARLPQVRRVALWGLCDGASAALLYCDSRPDARVAGLCLLNPWVRSAASLAQTHVKHYYRERLAQREFWVKLLRGRVAIDALTGLLRSLWTAAAGRWARRPAADAPLAFQQRMARGWQRFEGRILLLLSGRDYTAREFTEHSTGDPAWQAAMRKQVAEVHQLATADHTFSNQAARAEVEALTLGWLAQLAAAPPRVGGGG